MLTSFEVSAELTGTGTADDPFIGVATPESEFDTLVGYSGSYFAVGTTLTGFAPHNPDYTSASVEIDEGFGLSLISGKVDTISGTLTKTGDFHWYVTYDGTTTEYVLRVVDPSVTELEFISNPEDDGVVSYV